jgi:isopentenyl-diphosphate Delta-isomerase
MEQVLLVDSFDNQMGLIEKMAAHVGCGKLHRAVSVIIYRKHKQFYELLLQKRCADKPLWPCHWSNTVCTHPRDGESAEDCAVRRLFEEMGILYDKSRLKFIIKLNYQAQYNNDLAEHELDSVYVGQWNGTPNVNHDEAAACIWKSWDDIEKEIEDSPENFTPWFKKLMEDSSLKSAIFSL